MADTTALDELLDTIDAHDQRGERDEVQALIERGRAQFPDAVELWEWEATLAIDDERYTDALAVLDRIIALLPDDFAAHRERASVLLDLGRCSEALASLDALPADERSALAPTDQAGIQHERGLCLDRLGRPSDADVAYKDAAQLDPDHYFVPARYAPDAFEALVAAAVADMPDDFRSYLSQVTITVQSWPPAAVADPFQLSCYQAGVEGGGDTIVLYQRPHELQCDDQDSLQYELQQSVVGELADRFALDLDDLDD